MSRAIQAIVMAIFVAGLSACAAAPAPAPETAARESVPTAPMLVGVWFRGLNIRPADPEREVFGLVLESDRTVSAHRPEGVTELLASAPIRATFRSAREALKVAADLKSEGPGIGHWVCVYFESPLRAEHQAPPPQDKSRYPLRRDSPLGDSDAGLHWPTLDILPPPLQQRGVAIACSAPPGNSMWAFYPDDRSTSILTSWEEIEAKLKQGPIRHDYRSSEQWIGYWADGQRRSLPWQDRAQLRQP